MPGPAPMPAPVKLLAGNPGHRPIPAEVKPKPGLPTCPMWLLPEAKREWRRLGPELDRLGLMTTADRSAFAGYCQAWARWIEAEKADSGNEQDRTFRRLMMVIQRFGLSPVDRARLASAEAPSAPSGIAGLLD